MRFAVYDLRVCPPSFDFLAFVILARYHGAEAIHFVPGICEAKLGYYSEAEQAQRVKTILEPVCDLYGMPYQYGPLDHSMDVAWPPFFRSGKLRQGYTFGWFQSIKEPEPIMPSPEAKEWALDEIGEDRIVVHLRAGRNIPGRNSGPKWWEWAQEHDAYVLTDDQIPLDRRVAIHEVALLNIGAAAGHMTISMFSKRPYVVMKFLSNAGISTTMDWHKSQGFNPGDQFPWSGKHQRLIWDGRDDYNAIEAAYQDWCTATNTPVACRT
jgi:hypothetical protein